MNLSAYVKFSDKLKALAHPIRLRVALYLCNRDSTVSILCKELNIPQAIISQHLSVLRNKGIVFGIRQRTNVTYSIRTQAVKNLLEILRDNLTESSDKRKRSFSKKIDIV